MPGVNTGSFQVEKIVVKTTTILGFQAVVVYVFPNMKCMGTLFSNEKEVSTHACSTMDEPQKRAQKKKPYIVSFHLYELAI